MIATNEKKLPMGWQWQYLGDLCDIVIGRTPRRDTPQYWNGKNPWVTISDLNNLIVNKTKECITDIGVSESRMNLIQKGTLLFSFKLTIGKMAYAGTDLYTNEAVAALFPKYSDKLDNNFLRFSLSFIDTASGSSHAVKGKTLNQDGLQAIKIPLPPLPEQKRIATILTERLAAVERARKASEARLEAARALPAAYLREVFESEEARGWTTIPLGDVSDVASGITLGRKLKESQETMEIPYLRVANVKDGMLDLEEISTVEATPSEIAKWQMRFGDLLLTEGGDPDKLGRGAVWEEQIPGCIHQNHIFRVRFRKNIIDPFFASLQMQSRYGKDYFLKHAKQTTGIATINQQVLKAFPLLMPDLAMQQKLARELMSRFIRIDQLNNSAFEEASNLSRLPSSLIRQAFSGAL